MDTRKTISKINADIMVEMSGNIDKKILTRKTLHTKIEVIENKEKV